MTGAGIQTGHHTSDQVDKYLNDDWDYVIAVCCRAGSFHCKRPLQCRSAGIVEMSRPGQTLPCL
ncbi:MAG TPA: hypothetical protein VLH61_03470 [Bacteroidales bacterium]|nr:hypothetical protein [Bacteroidales bacterium]